MRTEIWRAIAAGGTALAIPGLAGAATIATPINSTYTSSGLPATYGFALNPDGTFTAAGNNNTANFGVAPYAIGVDFAGNGTTLIADDGSGYPINFLPGDQVGPSPAVAWGAGGALVATPKAGFTKGNFSQGSGWVGFRVLTLNNLNYGAVSVSNVGSGTVTVNEILYDTTANEPLQIPTTPEPSTFALLALGAVGVLALRKRRKA
jgi:hypothetical protein